MAASLSPGARLGPYEIANAIGFGGMGEVYLARDTRLERQVAIKVIAASVADDPERLRRFLRESKTASALNHPNIAHVYEIGEQDGTHFLVMEYVRGEGLDRRSDRGESRLPMPSRWPFRLPMRSMKRTVKASCTGT